MDKIEAAAPLLSGIFLELDLTRASTLICRRTLIMPDFNRGIMKFKGADSPIAVILSGIIVIGAIAFLIKWALLVAYAI
jgi:hypothetical protein